MDKTEKPYTLADNVVGKYWPTLFANMIIFSLILINFAGENSL